MTLIAVIIAIALSHSITGIAGLRTTHWFTYYAEALNRLFKGRRFWDGALGVALVIVPPVLAVAVVQAYLTGLAGFVFGVAILVYTWGSRDLDQDVDHYLEAMDRGDEGAASGHVKHLVGHEVVEKHTEDELVAGIFDQSLQRWFGVLLWFCLFGAAGAVTFRLIQKLSQSVQLLADMPERLHEDATLLYGALAWPVAVLEILALAVSTNFDAVMRAWRARVADAGQGFVNPDPGVVGPVGLGAVNALQSDLADEEDTTSPTWRVRCAMRLLWRALMVWLTVLAAFTLVGWLG